MDSTITKLQIEVDYYAKKIEKISEPLYYYYSNQSSMSKDIDYKSLAEKMVFAGNEYEEISRNPADPVHDPVSVRLRFHREEARRDNRHHRGHHRAYDGGYHRSHHRGYN